MKKRIVKLTESDLQRIVKRVISESNRKSKIDENIFKRFGNKIAKGLGIDDESSTRRNYETELWKKENSIINAVIDYFGLEEDDYAAPGFRVYTEIYNDRPNIARISIYSYLTQKEYEADYNLDTGEITNKTEG